MAVTGQKAADAFKNIREVSDELDVPQHVLRFWESKFSEIRPLKRGGRRRYYRPEDVALLRTIRDLLYIQGYKIRGVQRLLREGKVTTVDSVVTVAPSAELEREGLGPEGASMRVDLDGALTVLEDGSEDDGDGDVDQTAQPSASARRENSGAPARAPLVARDVEYQEIEVTEIGIEELGRVQNRLMSARHKLLAALQSTEDAGV